MQLPGKERHQLHESLAREDLVRLPSDRSFGLTMAAVFGVLFALIGLIAGRWHPWLVVVGGAFLLTALLFPAFLHQLNRLWLKVGLALHGVVNPIVLGAMFAFITVIGWIWRLKKRNPLNLRLEPGARSYWIERRPPAPNPRHFPYQF
jgi:hypothetical protein